MKLVYYKDRIGNFGDDMNAWLWPRLLPGRLSEDDDGHLFLGIGTILSARLPGLARKTVFGSGAGYRRTRPRLDATWDVRFVRGPATARYLGVPPAMAITDPALLVRQLYTPRRNGMSPPLFVPHHVNARQADWKHVCAMAGIDYLDPAEHIETAVDRIAGASCVLAESMHAAIVADAYRVPWIPIVAHHKILLGKWQDWCTTIGLDYRPYVLATGLRDEAHRLSRGAGTRLRARRTLRRLLAPAMAKVHACAPSSRGDYEKAAQSLQQAAREPPRLSDRSLQNRLESRLLEEVARLLRNTEPVPGLEQLQP